MLDKGRVAGAHLLSGAVVNPSALRDLLPGEDVAALPGCFGPVTKEAVYLMSKSFEVRIPTPPPFHNKGNLVFSLSQLGRHMAELAEQLGAMVLPETDAQRLLVADGAVRGVKTGDKGLGPRGRAARVIRAGRRGARPGDGVVRGDAGSPGRRGDGAVRAERASSRRRGAWA